jgi:hypothetical protein
MPVQLSEVYAFFCCFLKRLLRRLTSRFTVSIDTDFLTLQWSRYLSSENDSPYLFVSAPLRSSSRQAPVFSSNFQATIAHHVVGR